MWLFGFIPALRSSPRLPPSAAHPLLPPPLLPHPLPPPSAALPWALDGSGSPPSGPLRGRRQCGDGTVSATLHPKTQHGLSPYIRLPPAGWPSRELSLAGGLPASPAHCPALWPHSIISRTLLFAPITPPHSQILTIHRGPVKEGEWRESEGVYANPGRVGRGGGRGSGGRRRGGRRRSRRRPRAPPSPPPPAAPRCPRHSSSLRSFLQIPGQHRRWIRNDALWMLGGGGGSGWNAQTKQAQALYEKAKHPAITPTLPFEW